MSRRLARAAIALYPIGFRRRYGEEMRDLIDETPASARTVADLVRVALVAHLRPGGHRAVGPEDRLRASASGVLACWVAFAAAGFCYAKTTEDATFDAAGRAHPLLAHAHGTIQTLAIVASAAIVLGSLPIALAAIVLGSLPIALAAFAGARRDERLRGPLRLALGAIAAFAGLTALLVVLARSHPGHGAGHAAFAAWIIVGIACGALCVLGSRRALFALPVDRARLVFALACGTVAVAAMTAMAAATAVYAVALPPDAVSLGQAPNGPLRAVSTNASLGVTLAVMAVATALAVTTTRRGWRAAGAA